MVAYIDKRTVRNSSSSRFWFGWAENGWGGKGGVVYSGGRGGVYGVAVGSGCGVFVGVGFRVDRLGVGRVW